MFTHVLISTILSISATLFISIVLIKKRYHVKALRIFIFLYIVGQIIGYRLGVDILKSAVPSFSDPENGVVYQVITSTILPLLLAFIIKDIFSPREELNYRIFIRMMLLILILIGLFQFTALPKVYDYILLVLAIASGGIGFFKKIKSNNDV